jgi:AAA domain
LSTRSRRGYKHSELTCHGSTRWCRSTRTAILAVVFPSDAAILLDAIREVDAVLAVIDPITAQLDQNVDSHKDASLRSALAPLARIGEETTAALIAVWHLNKSNGTDPMMRLGGSIGGPGAARSALLLDRDPDDPDPDRGDRRVLAHFKCNVGPLQSSRLLRVEEVLLPADNLEPEVTTARIVDVGESPHSAETLLAAGGDDEGAGSDAAAFLLAELADGVTVEAKTMLKRAADAGISERTLKRAKKRVGVESRRAGFGGEGGWTWTLKDATPYVPPTRQPMALNDDVMASNGDIGGPGCHR